jgi:hypothetical protein
VTGRTWAVAAAGALLILVVVLALTVGGHSGAHPVKRTLVAGWAGISSPGAGGVYPQGQWVATSFSCAPSSGGSGLKACSDSTGTLTVSGGHGHLDTSSTGLHRYWVAAIAKSGQTKTASITYAVVPPLRASIGTPVATAANARTHVMVACSGGGAGAACRGSLTLSIGRRVASGVGQRRSVTAETVRLAGATYSVASGSRRSIRVWLTDAGVLALRGAPGHQLQAHATIALNDGQTAAQTITLRRRQRAGI